MSSLDGCQLMSSLGGSSPGFGSNKSLLIQHGSMTRNDFHFELAVVVVMVAMTMTMMIVSHLTGPLDGVS